MKNLKILLLLVLLTIPTLAAKIKSGDDLIAAMHKKYESKWYKTLTFVQKTTLYKPDGTAEISIWYEAMSAPGKLRIDIAPLEKGNGILFLDGTLHRIRNGKVANSQPFVHPSPACLARHCFLWRLYVSSAGGRTHASSIAPTVATHC